MPNSYIRHLVRKVKRALGAESRPPASAYKWHLSYFDVNTWRQVTHAFLSKRAAQDFKIKLLRDRDHAVHAQGANLRVYQKGSSR